MLDSSSHTANESAADYIAALDKDGDGQISFDEFHTHALSVIESSEEEAKLLEYKEQFGVVDKDGSGEITQFELQNIMDSTGAANYIAVADKDGNGQISFDEFYAHATR